MKTIMLALLLSTTVYAQQKPVPNQSAYVVALKTTGASDLAVEKKLKEEFSKQKTFKLASTLAEADFVFVMYLEYEFNQAMVGGVGVGSEDIKSLTAFAVKPDIYTRAKKEKDLDGMKDDALWQHAENNGMWRGNGLPKKVVQKFCDEVKGK